MNEIAKGIIGVLLGLSIAANAALIYGASQDENSWLNRVFPRETEQPDTPANENAANDPAETETVREEHPAPVTASAAPANGLALFTSSRMPSELSDSLFKSVHSMVYDNESVFYIPYANQIAANEAGLLRKQDHDPQILANLWPQNLNRFIAKNKEFSDSLSRFDSDAYATFIIVDNDDHEKILAIVSDGLLYYDFAKNADADPFALYDTRWNKYIRRDLSELLDNPSRSTLPAPVVTSAANPVSEQTTTPDPGPVSLDSRSYFHSDGNASYGLLVVTNDSKRPVTVHGNGRIMDKGGDILASGRSIIEVLGPGETSAMKFRFDGVAGGDHMDYNLYYEDTNKPAAMANLEKEQSKLDDRVIITLKNTGNSPVRFVEAYAVFLDKDNKVVKIASNYQVDPNREIKPGATFSTHILCDEPFESVQTFVYGTYAP